jgi:ADP-ribose pyrophosphatase
MKRISIKKVYEGNWLSVLETVYLTKKNETIIWESIERKKCKAGVVALAKLIPSHQFIIIKQFRAAIHGYVLGLPAGLSDDDPQHALVELKEETGYHGKIVKISPLLKTGSTITNESGRIVCIEVDERRKENKKPIQNLEPGEDIEVFLVTKKNASKFLTQELKKGTYVSSVLWYLFGLSDWMK